jgi:hypothetical protein
MMLMTLLLPLMMKRRQMLMGRPALFAPRPLPLPSTTPGRRSHRCVFCPRPPPPTAASLRRRTRVFGRSPSSIARTPMRAPVGGGARWSCTRSSRRYQPCHRHQHQQWH